MRHALTLAAALLLAHSPVHATTAQPGPYTLSFLGREALTGMQLAMHDAQRRGRAEPALVACVDHYDAAAFRPHFEPLLLDGADADELAQIEHFFASPAGLRYTAYSMDQLYRRLGKTPPRAFKSLSVAEQTVVRSFAMSPGGRKLFGEALLDSESAKAGLQQHILRLVDQCRRVAGLPLDDGKE